MTRQGTYLYAVTRSEPPVTLDDVVGIGGAAVHGVAVGELVCVVSGVEMDEFDEEPLRSNMERLDWLERVAREHDAVIRAVSRRAPVLPLRLATVYWDDASAAGQVARRQAAALEALGRVENRDEWGVKVFLAPAEEAPAGSAARPGSGTEYLRRRRAEVQDRAATQSKGAEDALEIFGELAAVADDSRRHRPQDPSPSGHEQPMLLNAAYLVGRSDEARFRAAVDKVAAGRPAGAVELTGPWPPYSFVEWPES